MSSGISPYPAVDALGPRHSLLLSRLSQGQGRTWHQRIGAFASLPALIRELGLDPDVALKAAGLAPGALGNPSGEVPYASIGRLLEIAAEQTRCAHLGLLAGRVWHVDDLGLVSELVRHSPSVGEALRTLTVYQHLNSGGGMAFLLERTGVAEFGYAIYQPHVRGTDQLFDAALAAGYNLLRELCGPGFAATDVLIPRAKPADVAVYRNTFRLVPRFDSEVAALRFPDHWMRRPIDGADPERFRQARERAERSGREGLIQRVMRALRVLMLGGNVSGEDTARMLSMHRRTLNRRLKAQGTTFQAVLDQVRFETARQLLESTNLPLDDVAATLGYASVSPFMRSFRRWTGTTPGQWRRTLERSSRSIGS